MADVIRRIYECVPRCEGRYTRDEILDNPFRDICGLPGFLEDYRYERMGLFSEESVDEEDGIEGGFARTGAGDDNDPGTKKGNQTRRYKAVYGQKAVRIASARQT